MQCGLLVKLCVRFRIYSRRLSSLQCLNVCSKIAVSLNGSYQGKGAGEIPRRQNDQNRSSRLRHSSACRITNSTMHTTVVLLSRLLRTVAEDSSVASQSVTVIKRAEETCHFLEIHKDPHIESSQSCRDSTP